jgi:hypothetical protein
MAARHRSDTRAILSHVFEKNSERDIFSLERTPGAGSVRASAPPEFFPYAAAWKEFDKLYKAIHGNGPWRFVRTAMELLAFSGGVFGLHPTKQYKLIVLIGYPAIVALEIFRWLRSRKRFLHWQCPRCHSEWPGDKTEKDRACLSCGLRLHQMSP